MEKNSISTVTVKTTPQAITGTFANVGDEINVIGYKKATVYVDVTNNDTTDIQFKPILRLLEGASTTYTLPIKSVSSASTAITDLLYELDVDTDMKTTFTIEIDGTYSLQIQVAGTGNIPAPGTVNSMYIVVSN